MSEERGWLREQVVAWLRPDETIKTTAEGVTIMRIVADGEAINVVSGTWEFIHDWQYGNRLEIINAKLTVVLQRLASIGGAQ